MTDESPPGKPPTLHQFTRKDRLGLLVGCGLMMALCPLCSGCFWWSDITYSEGERVGVIVKFSNKGLIWKSWEGEMQLGGARIGGDGVLPNLWEFSLRRGEEADLVKKISAAQESGKRVKVRYRQALWGMPWRGGTSYYVESLEVLEP